MLPSESKILIVDDFETVLIMLKNALEGLGYTNIDRAPNGKVALEMLRKANEEKAPYSVILTDWNMPILSGLDLIKICQGDANLKNIPIIMITAEAEQKQVMEAMEAGAIGYITKPVSSEELRTKLQEIGKI